MQPSHIPQQPRGLSEVAHGWPNARFLASDTLALRTSGVASVLHGQLFELAYQPFFCLFLLRLLLIRRHIFGNLYK